MTVRVRVIEPGVYAGDDFRALPEADTGDVIAVADIAYAQRLVALGMVILEEEAGAENTAESSESVEQPEKKSIGRVARAGRAK